MKVIREGTPPNPEKQWWHGRWNCLRCWRQIELEPEDVLPLWHERSHNEVEWRCDKCGIDTTWRKNPLIPLRRQTPIVPWWKRAFVAHPAVEGR